MRHESAEQIAAGNAGWPVQFRFAVDAGWSRVPELWTLGIIKRHMTFTPLPKTRRVWELTCVRSCIFAGAVLLPVQIWARTFLAGWTRQYIEEQLWLISGVLCVFLLCCSVGAFLRRERVLGATAAFLGILSMLIRLLPILLHEGARD
jgi:hypothetical protein